MIRVLLLEAGCPGIGQALTIFGSLAGSSVPRLDWLRLKRLALYENPDSHRPQSRPDRPVLSILLRKRDLLTFNQQGRIWLTFFAMGIITLMDEFTSIFYVPAESYRFIGLSALVFIPLTSILIRFLTTRFTEIAEILEHHGLIGGGVYSFSYLVLGPMVSFVAVSSIMVDYILTACISAVSAVSNATSFFPLSGPMMMVAILGTIWAVAGLNILGIRENARFTFMIFIAAAFVILNLIVSGFLHVDAGSLGQMHQAVNQSIKHVSTGSWYGNYGAFISSIAFCILAFSGVESVIQTAGLVRSWKEIRKAYLFLALTVGLVTPLVTILVLSAPIDFKAHEGDLITYFATMINGVPFGIAVAALASITLMMAINTAFVASSELMERVAHRYGFHWLIATNRRQSLYRIHLCQRHLLLPHHFPHHGQPGRTGQYVCPGSGGLLLHQYGVPHPLPLLHGHGRGHDLLHQPPGHPHPLDHPGELLYLPGHRQDSMPPCCGPG